MPRQSRGPRLYLRKGRVDARTGRPLPDLYYIRDGASERGTGCGPGGLREAERALAAYIAEKGPQAREAGYRPGDPSKVCVADVVALYAAERAPQLSDPESTGGRLKTLLAWWGARKLADVTRSNCRAYVAHRIAQPRKTAKTAVARKRLVTEQGARRELEDLSAAISYWDAEHHLSPKPKVSMPEKRESPRDALTRAEGAALLKAAMGYRKGADGHWARQSKAIRARRAHLRRFVLIGFYTGTRPGAVKRLLWQESPLQAWVDLDRAVIHRRGRAERETKKRRPIVKMPKRLVAHMRRWARLDAALDRQIGSVVHYAGDPVGSVKGAFAAVVADAGLDARITPHWLRHTAATWLMEAAEDPWSAAGYMGMTMETLENCYGHHRPDFQAKIAASPRRSKTA